MKLVTLLGALSLCVYIGCRLNTRVKYLTKYLLYTVFSGLIVAIFIPFMLIKPFDFRNGLMPAWLLKHFTALMGVTYEIKGKENIVKNTGCVLLINHQSLLDLTVLTCIWPWTPNGCTIVRKEMFWFWPLGLGGWLWGTIYIDKHNPEEAKKGLNKVVARITEQKARIVIFPEGTRHAGDELLTFKKGAFHLAMAAKCPIQPVIVSKYKFLDHQKHKFEGGHNYITFLPEISTEGLNKGNMPAFIDQVYKTMNDSFKEINNKL